MSVWTPDAISQLVIQLTALAVAVTAILAGIQKLRGDVQDNTAVTKDVHAAITAQTPADLPPHG